MDRKRSMCAAPKRRARCGSYRAQVLMRSLSRSTRILPNTGTPTAAKSNDSRLGAFSPHRSNQCYVEWSSLAPPTAPYGASTPQRMLDRTSPIGSSGALPHAPAPAQVDDAPARLTLNLALGHRCWLGPPHPLPRESPTGTLLHVRRNGVSKRAARCTSSRRSLSPSLRRMSWTGFCLSS